MAYGLSETGGLMSVPDVTTLGQDTWAQMSGMHPGNALVGGYAGAAGYGHIGQRITAVQDPTGGLMTGAPTAKGWQQLFNLKGNPTGWLALILIAYLGLTHLHLNAKAK